MTNSNINEATENSHHNWQNHADMDMLQSIERELQTMLEDGIEAQSLIESAIEEINLASREAQAADFDAARYMQDIEEQMGGVSRQDYTVERMA